MNRPNVARVPFIEGRDGAAEQVQYRLYEAVCNSLRHPEAEGIKREIPRLWEPGNSTVHHL